MVMEPAPAATADAAEMLTAAGRLDGAGDVLEFFRRPWKWQPEVDLWRQCGSPRAADAGWVLFAARLAHAQGPGG